VSFSEPHLYLISYDIADPRRLQRVHAFLRRHALPVQYSVFLARLSERRLVGLLAELARRIDPGSDDVRAYPLPQDAEPVTMGRQFLPSGVMLADPLLAPLLRTGHPHRLRGSGGECDKEEDLSREEQPEEA